MLDVKRLRILREVAQQGSFSAAADALYLSQSAVSQQIATLEKEVGMKLLDRTREGPKLTDAGRVLVSHAEAAIARLDEAERELAAIAGLEGGELRMASFPSASASLLTEAVSVFHRRHPKVRLSVADAEPEESLPRLRAGEVDVALSYEYDSVPERPDPELDRLHLLDDRMHAALPADHPLARRSRLKMSDLSDEAWIGGCGSSTCARFLVEACKAGGFEPKVAFESDDYPTMQGLVAAWVGVTLLPDLVLAAGVHPKIEIRPLGRAAPLRTIWAVTLAQSYRSPAVEAMLGILQEEGDRFGRHKTLAAAS
jgi:molybdate transport repressor ModE-like protein